MGLTNRITRAHDGSQVAEPVHTEMGGGTAGSWMFVMDRSSERIFDVFIEVDLPTGRPVVHLSFTPDSGVQVTYWLDTGEVKA